MIHDISSVSIIKYSQIRGLIFKDGGALRHWTCLEKSHAPRAEYFQKSYSFKT